LKNGCKIDPPTVPSQDYLGGLGRVSGDPERAGEVVGRSRRKDPERQAEAREHAACTADRAVTTRDEHAVGSVRTAEDVGLHLVRPGEGLDPNCDAGVAESTDE
jgi:hypothetical protein